jgi:hypothetical protein
MNPTLRAWLASFTRRWHTNPDLCDTHDPVAAHQGRVALLLLSIYPDASRTLLAHAITHDQGEAGSCDCSYDAKRNNPQLAGLLHRLEGDEIAAQGFNLPNLTPKEEKILKVCDWLDAWLWVMKHAPKLQHRKDWMAQGEKIAALADEVDLRDEVYAVLKAAEGRA